MFARLKYVAAIAVLSIAGVAGQTEATSVVEFLTHDIKLTLDVPAQEATIIDEGSAQVESGWNLFYLNGGAEISSLKISGILVDDQAVNLADTAQLPEEAKAGIQDIRAEGDPLLVLFESAEAGEVSFTIEYKAMFADPVENVRFSRENVGGEIKGTIVEQGAYLSSNAYYYPTGREGLSMYRLTADIPGEWHCIADGNLMSSEESNGRRIETFENPYANDGCTFMAAPYVVRSVDHDGVEVACYFFEADTALIDGYIEATTNYLTMYSDMIGPYPFERFTVAENFFPTGYGMPAWTLLGQQVLRLPFIKHTSLGHEVLHNWWGNSVYVDYERGNWCEAATVYGAEYRYKLNESEDAAKAYRKDILKQYVSYVDEGNDFPIRDFKSRTSPGTRTIGYNKAMMVYHMIEEEIGSEPFWAAWKQINTQYQAQKISWEEWIEAFEQTSGQDLSWVIPQWIDRAGAPVLSLDTVGLSDQRGIPNETIRVDISQQGGDSYRLRIPMRFHYQDPRSSTLNPGVVDTTVVLEGANGSFEFVMPSWVFEIAVDPDYHLFRKLYPEEIEPIVSAVMGVEQKRFVAYEADEAGEAGKALFQSFGENLSEGTVAVETADILNSEAKDFAPVLWNPIELPEPTAAMLTITDSSVIINETEYLRTGHTFVLSGKNWSGFDNYMVILSEDAESLPRIGQLVPHYGKYSFLVFEGARNVGKGQWAVTESPLRKKL